ncbi:MAG: zinc metallopeptidase [Planctomycetes bacterium]|nr:zinc metallopeptidase [Planctomycetota bacterium]
MRWEGRRQSENVEDRRSMAAPAFVGGSLLTLLIMFAMLFFGADPRQVAAIAPQAGPPRVAKSPAKQKADEEMTKFVKTVLADNEDVWGQLFPKAFNARYSPPKLVIFEKAVQSACGMASAAAGPFYCPLDKKVYIDLAFYDELKRRFGAPGDFAQAYVIAHEIGHHVQNQLGISAKVQSLQGRMPQAEYNKYSVRMELQADFLAGVWAHHVARYAGILDEEDIYEAVNAAQAIGDDRIQAQTQGYVVQEAFTHGTSEQRARWFLYGLKTGDPRLMDRAFEVDEP